MVGRDVVDVGPCLAGPDADEDVVPVTARRHVQSMGVEIGVVGEPIPEMDDEPVPAA